MYEQSGIFPVGRLTTRADMDADRRMSCYPMRYLRNVDHSVVDSVELAPFQSTVTAVLQSSLGRVSRFGFGCWNSPSCVGVSAIRNCKSSGVGLLKPRSVKLSNMLVMRRDG